MLNKEDYEARCALWDAGDKEGALAGLGHIDRMSIIPSQPDPPPVTHLYLIDFEGRKPPRIEPSYAHRAWYGSVPCGQEGCPLNISLPRQASPASMEKSI